jgi:O-antigen ligase
MMKYSRAPVTSPCVPPERIRDRGLGILTALLAAALILYLTVPDDIFTPDNQKIGAAAMAQANPVGRTIKFGLLAAGLAVILARLVAARSLLRHLNRFLLMFLVLVPASYVWSISPSATLARFVSIMSIVSVCTAFCLVGWHPRRFQNVLRPVITLILAASVLMYLTNPEIAIEHGEGTLKDAWRGICSQKNLFGMISSMGVIFWVHAVLTREVGLIRGLAGAALAFTCVVYSRSSASLLATMLSCIVLLLCLNMPRPLRRYMPYMVGGFVMLVLLYALTILRLVPGLDILLVPVTHLTGKDTTFSNRSEIWAIIQQHVQLSPLLGSGYGAYWTGPVPTSPSFIFLQLMWFYPTESHNGYLEITNDLGFLGLTVLLGYLIQFTRDSIDVMRVQRAQGALFLGLFFQQAIMNLSESCWLEINSGPILPVMILATFALARTLQQQRRTERAVAAAAASAAAARQQPPRVRHPPGTPAPAGPYPRRPTIPGRQP